MPALFATPAFWYFVISTYLTYEITRQQAIAAKEQAEAQNEMAEELRRKWNRKGCNIPKKEW